MGTSGTDRQSIGRVLRDGFVVVASILIAFSLDAWWDGVQLKREVEEELLGVDREIATNMALVEYEIDFMSRIVSSGAALLELMRAEPDAASVVAADTLAWFAFGGASPTLDASTGSLEAMIASGRLQAVESTELRAHLAALHSRVQDAVEEQLVARSLRDARLNPLLGPIFDKARVREVGVGFYDIREPGQPLFPRGPVRVPNSLELRNIVGTRIATFGISLGEMQRLVDHLAVLRALIVEEVQ